MRWLLILPLLWSFIGSMHAHAQTCGSKRYCKEMSSCAEARFYLEQCGLTRLDGDSDGSPCENLCGDGGNRTHANPIVNEPVQTLLESGEQKCGKKTKCNQMLSCDEAQYYLNTCGVKRLDGDGDGTAYKNLCN
jgi:hypothetical protein